MRRVLLIMFLSFAGLVLLAAVGLGILLATFNPNEYTRRISAAVERMTGRQLQFQGNVTVAFFPTPCLKTGRLLMTDPGIFGSGSFLTVENATVSLALQPLLHGVLQIEEIGLQSPVLQLVTTASGQHNWEYGLAFGKADAVSAKQEERASMPPPAVPDANGTAHAGSGDGPDRVTALADPAPPAPRETGFFSHLVIQAERVHCKDLRVTYRDLRDGDSCEVAVNSFTLASVRQDADMPFAADGLATINDNGRKLRFLLTGNARLDATGNLSARIDKLDVTAQGVTPEPVAVNSQGELRYDPATRVLELRDLKGSFGESRYAGKLFLSPMEEKSVMKLTGELSLDHVHLDPLLGRLTPAITSGGSEDVKGAPNLTRPKVGSSGKAGTGRDGASSGGGEPSPVAGLGEPAKSRSGEEGKKSASVLAKNRMNSDVAVTVTAMTVNDIPVPKLSFSVQSDNAQISLPFRLEMFDGTATGSARLDCRKAVPGFEFSASVKGMAMEQLSRALSAKTVVSGVLSADVDVSGNGGSWKEIAPTLKGKASAQAVKGEVRDFALIPSDLRGIAAVPSVFPFERIGGSGKIERGILTSKDIALKSKLLSGTGGGTINLAFEQLDFGVDFMIAGQPPAIPVNITGPFTSLSSSVDIRTFMRNTAEGALTSPERANEVLKDAGKLLLR